MNLLTHTQSRFIPSSILIFALTLSGCGGGGGSASPDIPPASSASSVSSSVISSSSSSTVSSSSSSSSSSVVSSSSSSSVISSSSSSSSPMTSSSSLSTSLSSSSSSSSTASTKTGALIDSAVSGIHYETSPGGFSGSTNSKGEYQYAEGDTVVFSIGNLTFPTVTAKGIVTPLDMANSSDTHNQIALNIAALLQSLDTDGDPANGISINYSVAAASAQALNFNQAYTTFAALPAVANLTANSGSSTKTLVSQTKALAHLEGSLTKLNTASLIGTWSFQSNDLRYVLFILDSSSYVALTYEGGATFEYGNYTWNKTSNALSVTRAQLAGTTPIKNPFVSGSIMSISGDTITLTGGHGNLELSKLTSTTNPLIGGWISGSGNNQSVIAYTDTHYFHGQNGTADDNGKPGAEYGTYTNSAAGFRAKTLADTNLQWGNSHPCNIVDTHLSEAANDYSCMGSGDKDSLTVNGNILDAYSAANVIANQKNKWPRNNEPEHYYLNRVVKNDFEVFGLPHPLLGTWEGGGGSLIFSNNKTFTHVKSTNQDPNCQTGSATGNYFWDPLTSELNVTLFTDSTAIEEGDSCSFEGKFKLVLNGNQFVLGADVGDITFTKVTSSTGLVGTWISPDPDNYAIWLFTETQYFLSDYRPADGHGTESGTYTYNSVTGLITGTVLHDGNDDAGLSNANGGPMPLVIASDNNSFTIGDGFVAKRLK